MIQITPSPPTDDRGRLKRAASRAVAQYVAEHAVPPLPPRHPGRGLGVDVAPGNNNHGLTDQQAREQLEEEWRSRPSLPEEELPPHLQEKHPWKRTSLKGGVKLRQGRRALGARDQNPNISEYDGTKDPQDHLDRFLAKADLLDLSDAAYCKIFRTTLAGKAMAWFNQLPMGTIDSFEQLSQRFLHHFAINKRYPKTALYLFTVIQREHESLRDYVQRGRFRESIAGKPPATLDELLVRAEKYIRIEETSDVRAMTPSKRRVEEESRSKRPLNDRHRDRGRGPTLDTTDTLL
ncbi:UNVERIFIED_CONTAM: hypothetical protein Sradi_7041300 [Sesamum radiatum]|uniref:Retrotransposon gag domain-containing protein n=1 Tax=Sesamum radiatum TaxID=300843 RepID=A0AAW2JAP4_SESRA